MKRRHDIEGPSPGEDAALVIALLAAGAFGLAIATLLLFEVLKFLPDGIDTIVFICVVLLGLVVGRALFERVLSLPGLLRVRQPKRTHA